MIEHVTPAGGNVFFDIGFPAGEAELLLFSAHLMMEITTIIEDRELNHEQAGRLFGVPARRIKRLLGRAINDFTVDDLVTMLGNAGMRVHASLEPAKY